MSDEQPTPDPRVESPLGALEGREPPAPDWFKWALGEAPERSFITVDGAKIELLAWGERGKPGLMLVHGNTAHADWWSFIAPFLAQDYRVAAVSMSGMGRSDHREVYSFNGFGREIHAGALAAGLYEAPVKPVFIGHSFGGAQVFCASVDHPEWMRAAVLIDSALRGAPPDEAAIQARSKPNRIYARLDAALARFRFMPVQPCENLFIVDYIARTSLKRAPLVEGGEGWTWCFDPFIWRKLDRTDLPEVVVGAVPMVHVYGAESEILQRQREDGGDELPPRGAPKIVIPDCAHHVMADQPMALVTVLRGLLAVWPVSVTDGAP